MNCSYCDGEGYDPHDTDPMGSSMYSPCPRCNGTGLSKEGIRAKRAERVERAVDKSWEYSHKGQDK